MTQLAYLGTGLMGAPMARRLLDAGHKVTVWNRSRDKLAPLLARGAKPAASPAEAAHGAAIVMMCLSDTAAVEEVVFGAEGVAHAIGSEALLVDFSSMRPDATRRFAARLEAERGADPAMTRLVAGWPKGFAARRGRALGFSADASAAAIVAAYLREREEAGR